MRKWNLKQIYASEDELNKDVVLMEKDLVELESLKGKLNTLEGFRRYIELDSKICIRFDNIYGYAHMNNDLNQKDEHNSKLYSKIYSKYVDLVNRTSWVQPELIEAGKDKIMSFCEEKDLCKVKFNMQKLFELNQYVRTAEIEKVMAQYNEALGGYSKLYNSLCLVDNTSQKVVLTSNEEIEVHMGNFTHYLSTLESAEDRRRVFEAIYKFYDAHKATLAGIYNGIMQSEYAEAKNRGYASILESNLLKNNIDKSVYMSLIDTARDNTAPLLKYMDLRKKYFKLEQYHTYDRFLKFRQSKVSFTYEEAKNFVLDACKAMGDEYYLKACKALEDGRVDVDTQDGKRSGAYSASAYEKGPFILLNYNNNMSEAFTIAHEAGHSIHTLYSNENQPYETSSYVIFVAEIASTFNEQLFLDYMLSQTTDKDERVALLQQSIDNLIATFYRQTLFAEYEYKAHKLVEDGKAVTADELCNIMSELYLQYYGLDLSKEKYKSLVWAYIHHFYGSPFYVYQYATSFSASLAIYERVKNNVKGAKESYLDLLKAGGSDYPVNIVKKAGVDLTKKDSFMAVIHRLDELVNALEKELEE